MCRGFSSQDSEEPTFDDFCPTGEMSIMDNGGADPESVNTVSPSELDKSIVDNRFNVPNDSVGTLGAENTSQASSHHGYRCVYIINLVRLPAIELGFQTPTGPAAECRFLARASPLSIRK